MKRLAITRPSITCEVCGVTADASTHPCRFERGCSCWRGKPCCARGQALVEFALVAPVLLLLLLAAADVGLAGFHLLRMQNCAQTIAAQPAAEAAELTRLGLSCTATVTEAGGVRVAALTCANPLPLTGYLAAQLHTDASAPAPTSTPSPTP